MSLSTSLGFIGVGNMGRHVAANLLKSGYSVTVYDLRKEAATKLLESGANWADSPAELARASDVVLTRSRVHRMWSQSLLASGVF